MKFRIQKKQKKEMNFNNRINLIIAVIFLFFLAIIYRLYYLQVINHDLYSALAFSQHQVLNKLEPDRGKIYIQDKGRGGDENNIFPIAINKSLAHVYAVPKDIEDPLETAEIIYKLLFKKEIEEEVEENIDKEMREEINNELDKVVDFSEEELKRKKEELLLNQRSSLSEEEYSEYLKIRKELKIETKKKEKLESLVERFSKKNDPYEPIKDRVEEEVLSELMKLELVGISFLMQKHRYYPENYTAHLTGFLGSSGENKKGMYGLEGFFDEELSGKEGLIRTERDANGNPIIVSEREYQKAQNGSDLVLTIDRTIQFTACSKLKEAVLKHGADSGSVIIMDPKTGEIMAMCSNPDFDPNEYGKTPDSSVFNNQIIFNQYEPGSVFKTMTLAAGIDSGEINVNTTYRDEGSLMVEGWDKPIRNSDFATRGGHGVVDMGYVLEYSLNTGVIFIVNKMGDKNFASYIKNFGFGEKKGIELETESPGDISNLFRAKIRPVDSAVASFGQGITATPLQMISAYGVIANGGKLMKPYLVKEIINPDGTRNVTQAREIRRVISERAAMLTSGVLVNVIDDGHAKLAGVDGYYVAGKTGTAQVADKVKRGYGDTTIHTFVGFAPVEDPAFVMLVKLDDPKDVKYSASSAAPLFGDIADFLLNYLKIPKERNR